MLAGLTMPVMLTVGSKDNKSIRKVTAKKLIPIMQKLEKNFTYKIDYPGDHKWFWKVRKSHFADVKKFLDEHLK